MRRLMQNIVIASLLWMAACSGLPTQAPANPAPTLPPTIAADLNIVTGQVVFVPAYSEVAYLGNERRELTVTLAIHNTDLEYPIIIRSVRYYDTDGVLVRDFIANPVILNALATTGFVISGREAGGGWGSNFVVEWGAEQPVYEPVIEAIMVSRTGLEGISFISPGRVVSEEAP